jgi:glycosyltransferase involved in cell wall biosynthesis
MKLPFVSIIVPTLNEEKYIENCLKALKSQDYKGKYEIIVADGMSKDNTVKIAKKYADKVILVKKRGAGAGRNAGAKIAKGVIFFFIDADTVASFNLITEITKVMRKGEVIGASCPVLPLSANISEFLLYWFYNQFVKASLIAKKPQIAGICCAYEREAFEKIGGFNEKMKTLEDHDLSLRISKFGEIKFVESTFVLTSPRRIRAWGKTKAAAKYLKIYIKYLLSGKTANLKEYKPIR